MTEQEQQQVWRFDIRCPHCGKEFDLKDCEVGWRKLANTFNQLNEVGSTWARCPHCLTDTSATMKDDQ